MADIANLKIPCPECGKPMLADVHAPEDGAILETGSTLSSCTVVDLRNMDVWICVECLNNPEVDDDKVVLTRDDDYIKEKLKVLES